MKKIALSLVALATLSSAALAASSSDPTDRIWQQNTTKSETIVTPLAAKTGDRTVLTPYDRMTVNSDVGNGRN